VLIARVHPEIPRGEGIPDSPHDDEAVWRDRYRSILDLEKHLHANGTRIIKFFLHLSKKEQRKRFLARTTSRRRTGSSASRTSKSGNSGNST
jgi:polyphosphate kinase 2 (PPK2 family)